MNEDAKMYPMRRKNMKIELQIAIPSIHNSRSAKKLIEMAQVVDGGEKFFLM